MLNTLLGARRHSMGATLTRLEEGFGSLDAYLDWIGFDAGWRARLAETFVEPAAAGKAHESGGANSKLRP